MRSVFEKDHALTRRFQKIDIEEPDIPTAINILQGLKSHFEKHHNVNFSSDAIISAVELSVKFINDRQLPDKAIDIIDEAGAAQRILPENKKKKEDKWKFKSLNLNQIILEFELERNRH